MGGEKGEESRKGARSDHDLGLEVVARDDVANRAQSRRLNGCRGVHEEVNKPSTNTRFDHSLDLVVRTIREIRDSPARVYQNFIVKRVNELREHGESWRDLEGNFSK